MRLLAVCEGPPTTDPRAGDGSTLISREVLARLPAHVEVDLLHFVDREAPVDPVVAARCHRIAQLPMRPAWLGLAALPLQRVPRATWLRSGVAARDFVAAWSAEADVAYFHGLHTFGLLPSCAAPVVVNEVDPWSAFWTERGRRRGGAGGRYDLLQASRARGVERAAGERAAGYVVVNAADGEALGRELGRPIDVVPNGTIPLGAPPDVPRDPHAVVFVGSLDYAPNVDAARRLAGEVLPVVRRSVPDVRLVLAGRRPVAEVLALAGSGVEVRPDVPSVAEVLAGAAVAAYPTAMGRGTKNSVLEALAAGCAVVASPAAASGVAPGPHVAVAEGTAAFAAAVTGLLQDPAARDAAGASARRYAEGLATWDDVASRYQALFDRAAGAA